MSESVPDWLAQPQPSKKVPDWLSVPAATLRDSNERRELRVAEYELVLPRILEQMCAGYTLATAIKELPIKVDPGGFMRWLRKQPKYHELYKEAKEVRTEAWAGEIIRHAKGEDSDGGQSMNDTARDRLIVDTYKWLMSADNRKQYGDTKTIEVNQSISITAALQQAQGRVMEAQLLDDDDVDVIDATAYKQLPSGSDEDDDD